MIPNIIEFTTDPQLLGLTPVQLELWQTCTGREDYPAEPFSEVTIVAGARAGKDSRIAAPIVVYEAVFGGHDRHLSKGERGMIPLVAQDRRAAGIAFGYIREYLEQGPLLSGEVVDMLSTEAVLKNGISISCFPCTLQSLRGWSIPVAACSTNLASTGSKARPIATRRSRPRSGVGSCPSLPRSS